MIKKFANFMWEAVVWSLAVVFLCGALAGWGQAQEVRSTFVETFETPGSNVGGWTWGGDTDQFIETNGNPGRYLRDSGLVTFTPRASTSFGVASVFTGDYADRNVVSVGIDMAIPFVSGGVSGRTVTLILLNDNDTPGDLSDDWGAYKVTDLSIPPTGVAGITGPSDILQWVAYEIDVPASSASLPEGWAWFSRGYARRSGPWGRLMRDVDHVGFILGDPEPRYPLLQWDVAMENPRITTITAQ